MNASLAFPYTELPEPATTAPVAPGILWVRMPLPFQLNHINLWLLEDGDGWTLVDTGLGNDDTKALWEALFKGFGRPITRLISTHFHPDHMGLAAWFTERFAIRLWATQSEWLYGRMMAVDETPALVQAHSDFYRRAGFGEEHQKLVAQRGNVYRTRVVPVPPVYHRIAAGDVIEIGGRSWRVMVGGGHAPEHACLYCPEANILISGDHILPKISPIVGVWPAEPDADTLGTYLASIPQFRTLPEDVLVLPSHGLPFHGLHQRLDQLDHHHDARLAKTLAACATPATAWQVQQHLFTRPLDTHQTLFAASETVSHLHYLMGKGQVARETRPDGVWVYRQIG